MLSKIRNKELAKILNLKRNQYLIWIIMFKSQIEIVDFLPVNWFCFQVKTTNPKKYCVRPNSGIVLPRSTCDVIGTLNQLYFARQFAVSVFFIIGFWITSKRIVGSDLVTMQAQKEAPPDLQCRDKFLLQSVKVNDGVTPKDITAEMVSNYLY